MAAINWKLAVNVNVPLAREMVSIFSVCKNWYQISSRQVRNEKVKRPVCYQASLS